MNNEQIYRAISDIDCDLIEQAEKKNMKKKKMIGTLILVAASAVILIGSGIIGTKMSKKAENSSSTTLSVEDPIPSFSVESKSPDSYHEPSINEAENAIPVVSLSCFSAPKKENVIEVISQEAESYCKACKSGDMEAFAQTYPATVEAFQIYEDIIKSDIRQFDAELFYLWLYPEHFEATGKDVLLVGIRTRYMIPNISDDLNTGEPSDDESLSLVQSDWLYSPGFFFTYDVNTKECIRMDTLKKGVASDILLLADKSINISEQISSPDENDPTIVWSTQIERIISFDDNALPVLEENLPVFTYANPAGDYVIEFENRESSGEQYPEQYFDQNIEIIDQCIEAHGGSYNYNQLTSDSSVEFGILYYNEK